MIKRNIAVTIIVPVYGDWPSLSDCIDALKKCVDTSLHKVMLVNDRGPESEVIEKNILTAIEGYHGFEYYINPTNLGFVGNCNRAVAELDRTGNDILLLNSDTVVTKGFLEEMLYVLYSSPKAGTVSPRSNNASIMTVPLSTAVQRGIEQKKSYEVHRKIKNLLPRYHKVPVAHGFCMLIKRKLIKRYGLFDEVFGRGYGEEVDFCMRLAKYGYVSLVANRAYVFHMEARSFSIDVKAKLLKKNNAIIWDRYPYYRQQVRDYMNEAVLREAAIEKRAGVSYEVQEPMLKSVLKMNKYIYKLARRVYGFSKKRF